MRARSKRIVCGGTMAATALFVLGASEHVGAQQRQTGRDISPAKQKQLMERYPGIDADGDGALSIDEARAHFKAHPGARRGAGPGGKQAGSGGMNPALERRAAEILKKHPEADKDGDGKLTPEEARAFMQTQRDALAQKLMKEHPELDKDGDGTLSPDEMLAAKGKLGEVVRTQMKQKLLKEQPEADTDKDGQISDEELKAFKDRMEAEHRAGLLKRFPEADTNGDGKLSDGEMKGFKKQHRDQKPEKTGSNEDNRRKDRGERSERRGRANAAPAPPQ